MISQKRALDIAVAGTALTLLSPVLLLVALAIKLEDRGPAIYRQKRLGRNGRTFTVLKFRKFLADASGPMLPLHDDDRYSKVGRILEVTKLNELPQLFNILKGDMSLVGPRPEIVEFKHCFQGEYSALLDYAPGLFGPSQTAFRNEAAMYPVGEDNHEFYERVLFPRKAELDLAYYRRATSVSDAYWMARSLIAVMAQFVNPERKGLSSQPR